MTVIGVWVAFPGWVLDWDLCGASLFLFVGMLEFLMFIYPL